MQHDIRSLKANDPAVGYNRWPKWIAVPASTEPEHGQARVVKEHSRVPTAKD
jgi:hypothetical protein